MTNLASETSYTVLKELDCRRKEGNFKAVLGISWMPDEMGISLYPNYLNESERQEACTYQLAVRQKAFLKGRYIAKKAAAVYLNDHNYLQHSIRAGIFGQPLLETNHPRKPGVSISHSGTMATCLVFDEAHPMAIDLEKIDPEKAFSIEAQISPHELGMCRQLGESKTLSFLRLWSMKEALSKVLKTGLSIEFNVLELEALDSSKSIITGSFRNFLQYKALSWIDKDYVWALVLPAQSALPDPEYLYTILTTKQAGESF